jgi:hypothetical protein
VVMAWSVDRLGRSLQNLVGFLSELHALPSSTAFSSKLVRKVSDGILRTLRRPAPNLPYDSWRVIRRGDLRCRAKSYGTASPTFGPSLAPLSQ